MYYKIQSENATGTVTWWMKESRKPAVWEMANEMLTMLEREIAYGHPEEIRKVIKDYLQNGGPGGFRPTIDPWRLKKIVEDQEDEEGWRSGLIEEILDGTVEGYHLVQMMKDEDCQPQLVMDEATGKPAEDDPERLEPTLTQFIMNSL